MTPKAANICGVFATWERDFVQIPQQSWKSHCDPPLSPPTTNAKLPVCEHLDASASPQTCPVILTQFICGGKRKRKRKRKVRSSMWSRLLSFQTDLPPPSPPGTLSRPASSILGNCVLTHWGAKPKVPSPHSWATLPLAPNVRVAGSGAPQMPPENI